MVAIYVKSNDLVLAPSRTSTGVWLEEPVIYSFIIGQTPIE